MVFVLGVRIGLERRGLWEGGHDQILMLDPPLHVFDLSSSINALSPLSLFSRSLAWASKKLSLQNAINLHIEKLKRDFNKEENFGGQT